MREVRCNTELTEEDKRRIEADDSIIYVFHGKRGGVVYAHDTVLRTLDAEAKRRNVERFYEVANRIVNDYCERMAKKAILEEKQKQLQD